MSSWLIRIFCILVLAALFGVGTGKAKTKDGSTDSALTGEPNSTVTTTAPTPKPTPPILTNSLLGTTTNIAPFKPTISGKMPADENQVATLSTDDLKEFDEQPEAVRKLISQALILTHLKLSYKYGSADPRNGGMDCSGTVYYLLNQAGLSDVPRDSGGLYRWVWSDGRFEAVISNHADTFELKRLRPGDLLFWTGTYRVDRDPPVSHVMIYLGTNRHNGHRVMVGASEGRTYEGKSRYGVSVFDFKLPVGGNERNSAQHDGAGTELQSRFVGYGSIPGLEKIKPEADQVVSPLSPSKG